MFGIRGGGEYGVVAVGVKTQDDLCARRFFHAQTLGADGHAAIAADFERGADAPDIRPSNTSE